MTDMSFMANAKKYSKLKLLCFAPVPGTHKDYREDRQQERIGKQQDRQSR
jgi:hypothetical protein